MPHCTPLRFQLAQNEDLRPDLPLSSAATSNLAMHRPLGMAVENGDVLPRQETRFVPWGC